MTIIVATEPEKSKCKGGEPWIPGIAKKREDDFVPVGNIISKALQDLQSKIVPTQEQGELFEMTNLYNARGLRIEGKKAVVIAKELEEVNIALAENFPLVVRNYGGTTHAQSGKCYPGCIFYVQTIEDAERISHFVPTQSIIPKKPTFPYHVTFRGRKWSELIWLAQRFMREHFEKQTS